MNSTISKLWGFLPTPNDPTTNAGDQFNTQGYLGTISLPLTSNNYVGRIDHDFNSKHRFYGRWTIGIAGRAGRLTGRWLRHRALSSYDSVARVILGLGPQRLRAPIPTGAAVKYREYRPAHNHRLVRSRASRP